MGRRLLVSFTISLYLGLSGCMSSSPHLQTYKTTSQIETCRIGILPLINRTDFDQGDKIVYRTLLSQLVNEQKIRVAIEGDVTEMYRELHLKPWTQPNPEQMQIIASRLDVDILIGGEIIEMKEPVEGGHINPHLKIQLQVYNGQDGTIHWSTYHERQGIDYRKIMHFGLNNTISQLGNNIIKEILELWKEEALLQCQN